MEKEKEIFRECFNLLTDNLKQPNWGSIAQSMPQVLGKYKDNDNKLASELMLVIIGHIERVHGIGKVE